MSVQPWRPDRDLAARFHGQPVKEEEAEPVGCRQMWRCGECRAERQWGYGRPEVSAPVFLLCAGNCQDFEGDERHTKHVFSRVSA